MTKTRRDALKLIGAASAVTVIAAPSWAQDPVTHEVQMYNKHPDDKKMRNVFAPDLLQINPGDTVKFISADKGHNSVSDKNMMPEGAEGWKSKLSKDFEVTLTVEGTYGYYCQPHRSLGMVGLILVGDASGNYEDAKDAKQSGKAKSIYEDIFERADALQAG